jgi:hypothetical protein
MTYRHLSALVVALALVAIPRVAGAQPKHPVTPTVQVYKSATCGCCAKWIEHLKTAGLSVEVHELATVDAVKNKSGVPASLRSCHTALVGGYVVEGHVPADLVVKMLKERPKIAGIAVPGMPAGSPGMEMGDRRDPFDVMAWTKTGETSVYASR